MHIEEILYTQGFGTRRVCAGLVQQGFVTIDGAPVTDPGADVATDGLRFTVQGTAWAYHEKAYLMLHKPAGTECSQKPSTYPSIYTLLPSPLRLRPNKGAVQGVQAIGRLDQDTTGLLLLTDDGTLLHRWTSPRHHVPKVYDVSCKHPVTDDQIARLLGGVVLLDDPQPVKALAAEPWHGAAEGLHGLRLTLAEGKYHQVKRMLAAVGNRVEALHRSRIGQLALPDDLAPGQWRWLDADQVEGLRSARGGQPTVGVAR